MTTRIQHLANKAILERTTTQIVEATGYIFEATAYKVLNPSKIKIFDIGKAAISIASLMIIHKIYTKKVESYEKTH